MSMNRNIQEGAHLQNQNYLGYFAGQVQAFIYILPEKVMEYLKSKMETLVFDLLEMAWHQAHLPR